MRFFALSLLLLTSLAVSAQTSPSDSAQTGSSDSGSSAAPQRGEGNINPTPPQGISVDEVIRRFAEKESEFRKAWNEYAFRQDVKVQTLDGDTVDGEYREVTDITFTDKGKRVENVVFAPQSTLVKIDMSREDLDDIRHRFPFVLGTEDLPLYQILYVGKQRVDELETYVFDIAPKKLEKDQRYVQGRIWVDQQDLQIVKTRLKPAYLQSKRTEEQQFPSFNSYREQIDGRYWFPTYVKADEVLHFRGGKHSIPQDVHIRIIVKYTDYKKFGAKSRVIFAGEEVKDESQPSKSPPAQNPQQQPDKPKE